MMSALKQQNASQKKNAEKKTITDKQCTKNNLFTKDEYKHRPTDEECRMHRYADMDEQAMIVI